MLAAICDDCKEDLGLLKSYIENYSAHNSLNIELHTYDAIESVKSALNQYSYDILFLDIYVNKESGIAFAESIRNQFHGDLVFVTVSQDFAVDAFRLNAIHYLVKPVTAGQIAECFSRVHFFKPARHLNIVSNYNDIQVPEQLIQYMESYTNTVIIHTENQTFSTHESLGSVLKRLDPGHFIRPYRSYIVNMNYIDHLYKGQIILKNHTHIPVARQKKKEIQERYHQFLFRQIE